MGEEGQISKEKIAEIERLIKENDKNGVVLMVQGCLKGNGYDIEHCRTKDYNPEKGTGKCCEHYENKCRTTIESLMEEY